MKKLIYVIALLVFFLSSCTEKWDEHYSLNAIGNDSIVSNLNLLDYLKTQPQYSKFVEALEKTGVAQELSRDQYLTVWAVDNEEMDKLASIGMVDTFVMKFHVNYLKFTYDKLKDGMRLKTLNNKYIPVKLESTGVISAANVAIKKANQICKNGVVHELSELMVPMISIYDYVSGLGSDYSMIRDSILSLNDTLFDKANSVPVGVDRYGNTVYDSVKYIKNPIMDTVDIRSEFSQSTMLLPSNAVILKCIGDMKTQYEKIGKAFTKSDTLLAFGWIKRAIFYKSKIDNYGSTMDITSAFKKIWRTTVQQVDPSPREMSNGLIYTITYMKIPVNVYITRIKSLVYYYQYCTDDQKNLYYHFTGNTNTALVKTGDAVTFKNLNNMAWTYYLLNPKGDMNDGIPLAVEFNPVTLIKNPDGTQSAKLMEAPLGEYQLWMGFLAKSHPYVNIYFNGKLVKSDLNVSAATPWNYDRNNQTQIGTDGKSSQYDGLGGYVGDVTVTADPANPEKTLNTFTIKVEFSRPQSGQTTEQLSIYHWALIPSTNNY